jgi:enolase-phosphatase E1
VTVQLSELGVRTVLLDIEGTTTPIAFVHEVLFPFARLHLAEWLSGRGDEADRESVGRKLDLERAADPDVPDSIDSRVAYARWLMDQDRKSPALKELQGLIWERGYQAGQLRGIVFDDVPPAIRGWRMDGYDVAIYSSGSELAQRRLFQSVPQGDLTPLISRFFDTRVGAKKDPESYRAIARALGGPASLVLFLSDVVSELEAAREAGCHVALTVRPGNAPQPRGDRYPTIASFAEVG